MTPARIAAFLLCLGMTAAPARGQDDTAARVEGLVAQLGAARHADREAAMGALLDIGTPAAAALEAAARGDDPEIRERAKALLVTLRPLAGLASRDRQERIAASLRVCAMEAKLDLTGVREPTDPPRAVMLLSAAVRANPDVMNSHIRRCLETARKALDEPGRAAFDASDVGLYLSKDFAALSQRHPASPLAGKAVYDDGRFEDYLRKFPEGFYAPRARYCLIAGKKRYSYTDDSPREALKITSPDAEIAAWQDFLKKYPDFEGADDANYRYARALEMKGKLTEACLRLRLRFPDGDMERQTTERLLVIMDAKMDARQLEAAQQAMEKDKRPAADLPIPSAQMAVVFQYLQALKLGRKGEHAAAAEAFQKTVKSTERLNAKPLTPGGPPVPGGYHEYGDSLMAWLWRRSRGKADLHSRCAHLASHPDGDNLYQLASLVYKSQFSDGLRQCSGRQSSYFALANAGEYYQQSCAYWQAAQVYRKVMDDFPQCPSAPKALYMLANCYCRMAGIEDSQYWISHKRENVKAAIEHYNRFVEKYPNHELAPDAAKAAESLRRRYP